jgi:hypothetical protein
VLCDLEGKTRKEVARQLGVPEGTLSGWLTRGRLMLARRLARHGLPVSSGVLVSVVTENALTAGVPAAVVSTTMNAAGLLAAGPAATGVLSTRVAALTEGMLRTMLLTKLKIATAVLLMVSAGFGATGLIQYARANKSSLQSVPLAEKGTGEKPQQADSQKPGRTRVATRQSKRDLKITVGKETTYISGPFDSDGYIDYETALNEKLSKDVTPEKNANVLLWKALRPEPKRTPMPPDFFRWLQIPSPPLQGEYFIDLPRYATETLHLNPAEQTDELRKQRFWASQRPWITQDYPRIAEWLKANEKPLALVREATRCPAYYNPLVARKTGEEGWYELLGTLMPGAVKCLREVGPALTVRAMLHAGEGRFEQAWQDLLTCHRLGRLIARGADSDEFVIGLTIDQAASDAALALLDRANRTTKQVQAWQHDLNELPPIPPVADKVDLGLRFTFLDSVMLARRGPVRTLRFIAILEGRGKSTPGVTEPEPSQAFLESMDWDSILRTGNRWYDRVVTATRGTDRATRENEIKQIDEELKAMLKAAGTPADLIKAIREKEIPDKEVSKHLGCILTELALIRIRYLQKAADRHEQARRNGQVAFALAAYHGDNGSYPEKLDRLAPNYLEEVPSDLYSGKALIYRPSEKGYLLYSVGFNGQDEGGNGSDDSPRGTTHMCACRCRS